MNQPNITRRYLLGGWLLIILFLCVVWLLWPNGRRPLQPFRNTPTPANTLNGEPLLITFEELNADPLRYHNQRLRVTGDYQGLPLSTCMPFNGPIIQWALIGEGLQLNAQGFEKVLNTILPGLTLTVDGIWQLYRGPVGCGKQPSDGAVWYLAVERIVQPNPLLAMGYTPGATLQVNGLVTPIGFLATTTPELPGLPSPTTAVTLTITATVPIANTMTPTRLSTPAPGSSPLPTGTTTATLPPGITRTSTPTRTPSPGGTAIPSRTPTPTPTATAGSPPPITPTQPGYPGPQPTTPVPTNTPGSYP